jgi:tRNA-specific 2-thiouridylase
MKKLALLMSGGVDSSVAACLLQEQGYDVLGVHLELFTFGDYQQKAESYQKVQEVCRKLQIPSVLLDLKETFKNEVIESFLASYQSGKTPNPCVVCNKAIKFGAFLDYATQTLGADFISSGHYARVVPGPQTIGLAKATDNKKDQSYFLYQLSQEILSKLILPLGELTKPEVRVLASKFDLATDFGKESEDVCFFSGNFSSFIQSRIPDQPGNIIDRSGKILGHHQGIHYFTVGQRQGLGISSPDPLYVIHLDSAQHTVMVGKREDAYSRDLVLPNIHWISGGPPSPDVLIKAKVRYRGEEKACQLRSAVDSQGHEITGVHFEEPQFAITTGQSIVFYQGDQVLGGGEINKS